MQPGVYQTTRKDGTPSYRSSITYRNKHISLGSFSSETEAHHAYLEAASLLSGSGSLEDFLLLFTAGNESARFLKFPQLSFEKGISLLNFRDNRLYIANPIYLRKTYFSYYLSPSEELKFDIDDLFYYTRHKILRRKGHLFINDYGMQVTLLSRYGLKSYSVRHRDYEFANGDPSDLRYSNIIVINPFYGVTAFLHKGRTRYRTKIHINGNYTIGTYASAEKAAIAYNKAVDLAKKAGIQKNYPENYIDGFSAKEYAEIYTKLKISAKYTAYLETLSKTPMPPASD